MASSISSVRVTVLAVGCFSILNITAGFPLKDPSPLLIAPPSFTSATWLKVMKEPFSPLITVLAMSVISVVLAIFLISTSAPCEED